MFYIWRKEFLDVVGSNIWFCEIKFFMINFLVEIESFLLIIVMNISSFRFGDLFFVCIIIIFHQFLLKSKTFNSLTKITKQFIFIHLILHLLNTNDLK